MSIRSPRTHTFNRQGFEPLGAHSNTDNMSYDNGIPLSQIQSRASSTRGGMRKTTSALPPDFSTQQTFHEDEKRGMFMRTGGRRKLRKMDTSMRIGTDGEEVRQNWLGKMYSKVVNFSVVTKYFVYIAPVAIPLAAPIVIYAVLDRNENRQHYFLTTGVRVYLFWLWIEIVWLSLWISRLIAMALPWVFMQMAGVVSSGTRKYASIIKALQMPLALVGWAVVSLVTFTALTARSLNPQRGAPEWISVMKKLLVPALIGSVVLLIEKLLIQLLSVSYHSRSFDGRIRESKRNIYLIGLLYDASRALFPEYSPEFAEEDYIINDNIEASLVKAVRHGNRSRDGKSGTTTPLKLIGQVHRVGDKVTSVFGNIASEITGKQVFNPTAAHSIVVEALEKTSSSEALAKRLWMSFVVEGNDALYAEDIVEVLGPSRREEANEAFSALDNDGNGDVSLDEMILKIVDVGRDRKAISSSMRDVGQAIGVLDQVVIAVLFVIVVFIFVAFQNTNFVTTLATAGTTLLSLSFVFAASVQEFLGSCIFLFVKHPFDVGDRADISGESMVVEQISLLYTVFKRIDTMKLVQVPNIVLNNLWIENVTRSRAMKEQLDMFISFDTSLGDIEVLRSEMESFVRHPDNSRDFQPDIILEVTGIGNMDKLQLKVEILHKSNWHNETVRAARRSKFMCALVLALRKVPIYGPGGGGEPLGGPTNPGYSVAVNDLWAADAREKASKAKAAKRLVPAQPKVISADDLTLGPTNETNAADALNARRPTMDAAHRDTDINLRADVADDDGSSTALDRKRSSDIENLRDGLLKRQSTRGRRRPGESAPAQELEGQPGFTVVSPSPQRQATSRMDEEAALGFHEQPLSASPYIPSGPSGNPTYNIYPQPGQQPTSQQQGRLRKESRAQRGAPQ